MSGSLLLFTGPSGGGSGGALTASLSPDFLSGSKMTPGTVVTAGSVSCIVTGGTPPYTFLWVQDSGDPEIVPYVQASVTGFSALMPADTVFFATYHCQVTDASSTVVNSNLVSIDLRTGAA